jgi:putative DNA primase/helicase
MRINGDLVGCQLIDQEGGKKFLYGQQTKGATAGFNTKGKTILCEGYATALSVRAALKHAKKRYNILVCFSAGNMADVASKHDCVLIADFDKSETGQRVAKKSGRPYWISPVLGEDFNDYLNRVGLDEASLVISALID